ARTEGDRVGRFELAMAPRQRGIYPGLARTSPAPARRLGPAIEKQGRSRAGEGAHGEDEQRGAKRLATPFASIGHEQPELSRPRHRTVDRGSHEHVAAA